MAKNAENVHIMHFHELASTFTIHHWLRIITHFKKDFRNQDPSRGSKMMKIKFDNFFYKNPLYKNLEPHFSKFLGNPKTVANKFLNFGLECKKFLREGVKNIQRRGPQSCS